MPRSLFSRIFAIADVAYNRSLLSYQTIDKKYGSKKIRHKADNGKRVLHNECNLFAMLHMRPFLLPILLQQILQGFLNRLISPFVFIPPEMLRKNSDSKQEALRHSHWNGEVDW